MLRELARLSGGMLFLEGHVTDVGTARVLARDGARPPVDRTRPRGRTRHAPSPGSDWRTPLELAGLAAIWGGSFLFLRIATPHFGPLPLVDLRLALGALVLAPFLWRERGRFPLRRWPQLAAIGLVNTLVPFLLFAWSAERAPAGVSAIVNSMAVPFAALAAFALFGERIDGRRLAGLLAGLVGVAVLASGDLAGSSLGPPVMAGALAALFYGVSANVVKHYLADLPPIAVAAATLACGAVLLAPFAAWTWPVTPIPAQAWWCVVAIGIVCTGIAYAFYFRLIQRVGAPRATTVTYLVPIFGVLWAWLALGEPLTASMAAGGALILGGMLLGQSRPKGGRVPRRLAVVRVRPQPCTDGRG
jgi:drug/metabolite transporter (DMT)-like permease